MKSLRLLTAAMLGGLGLGAANAAVLNENFDAYTAGANLIGQGSWAETGTSTTNVIQVVNAATGDNEVALKNTGQDAYKAFSSAVATTAGTSLFSGADINVSAAQATGDYFLHLSNPAGTTTNFYQRLFLKSSGSGYVLGLLDTSGTGFSITYGTTELSLNTTYRVVASWDFNDGALNDTFQLYVNPASNTEGGNTAYLTHTWTSTSVAEPTALAAVNLRQGSASNAATLNVDNLIVSTDFAEAANLSVVPEPAGLSLLALAAASLLRRRR